MAKAERKETTESPAEMEARIRAELEAKIRSEVAATMQPAPAKKQTRAQAAAELAAFLKTLGAKPLYRLKEKAYIDDVLHDPESKPWKKDVDPESPEREPLIVAFMGRPGAHMVPVNEAAKKMYQKYPPSGADPIADLSIVGDEGTAALEHVKDVGGQAGQVLQQQ